jgi:hypothetical protein
MTKNLNNMQYQALWQWFRGNRPPKEAFSIQACLESWLRTVPLCRGGNLGSRFKHNMATCRL